MLAITSPHISLERKKIVCHDCLYSISKWYFHFCNLCMMILNSKIQWKEGFYCCCCLGFYDYYFLVGLFCFLNIRKNKFWLWTRNQKVFLDATALERIWSKMTAAFSTKLYQIKLLLKHLCIYKTGLWHYGKGLDRVRKLWKDRWHPSKRCLCSRTRITVNYELGKTHHLCAIPKQVLYMHQAKGHRTSW